MPLTEFYWEGGLKAHFHQLVVIESGMRSKDDICSPKCEEVCADNGMHEDTIMQANMTDMTRNGEAIPPLMFIFSSMHTKIMAVMTTKWTLKDLNQL